MLRLWRSDHTAGMLLLLPVVLHRLHGVGQAVRGVCRGE